MTLPPEPVDPREAGAILKRARNKLGLTQGQVIDAVGIPNQSYLSALENGRYNVANSEYLPALAQVLKLSFEEVRAINPSAVISIEAISSPSRRIPDAERRGWIAPDEDEPRVPQALEDAARLYGHGQNAPLAERRWLVELSGLDFREEPETPEDWLAIYVRLAKLIDPKGS